MTMRIVPVVDLMDGRVVRGVGGNRSQYRPVESVLTSESTPLAVAQALVDRFSFTDLYVADLDAIAGQEADWQSYRELADCGLRLWIDAGVRTTADAGRLHDRLRHLKIAFRLIVGSETCAGPAALREIIEELGFAQVIFSLDLKQGQPLASHPEWSGLSPLAIAKQACNRGVAAMILLDLADVGMQRGTGTRALARQLKLKYPQIELTGGGGVRSFADLGSLAQDGYDAVLVASALHNGKLTRHDIDRMEDRQH